MITLDNLSIALVQTSVPDPLRGRVMSSYTLTSSGRCRPARSCTANWLYALASQPWWR